MGNNEQLPGLQIRVRCCPWPKNSIGVHLESTQSDPRDTTTALLTCVPASTNAVAPVGSRNLLNGFHCFQCVEVVMQEAASSSLFSVPVFAEIEGVMDG